MCFLENHGLGVRKLAALSECLIRTSELFELCLTEHREAPRDAGAVIAIRVAIVVTKKPFFAADQFGSYQHNDRGSNQENQSPL